MEKMYEGSSTDRIVNLIEQAGGVVHRIDEHKAEFCLIADFKIEGRYGLSICLVDDLNCEGNCLNFVKEDCYGGRPYPFHFTIMELWNLIKNRLFIPNQ